MVKSISFRARLPGLKFPLISYLLIYYPPLRTWPLTLERGEGKAAGGEKL